MDKSAGPVAVVHLVRCANGIEPLRRFLESYAAHSAGTVHDLVFVLKGFAPDSVAAADVMRLIEGRSGGTIVVPDAGLDLDTYRAAAQALGHPYVCFLNSFSTVAADGWLAKMLDWAARPEIGIVGATASCESLFTDEIDLLARSLGARLGGAAPAQGSPQADSGGEAAGAQPLRGWRRIWSAYRDFRPFPNPHVRTNAFMLSRRILKDIAWPATPAKADAYRLESGRHSLTAQVLQLGLQPVVVGRDGRGYFRPDWPASGTFWQGEQENLLIEDNQTREYQAAAQNERRALSKRAWRAQARP